MSMYEQDLLIESLIKKLMMEVNIDKYSGFFLELQVIQMAEDVLEKEKVILFRDIVHNNKEVDRLHNMGLEIITHDDLKNLSNCKVLIRAHGEPINI